MKTKNKLERMQDFIDWFQNRIKSIHNINDEQFIRILDKI